MILLKNLVLSCLSLVLITASDPYFGTELILRKAPKETPDDVRERPWLATDSFRKYLEDHDDRVSDTFEVSKFFYPSVNFWFLIYTQFESSSVIIHDKNNLSLIYKVLDFSHLQARGLSKTASFIIQRKISEEKIQALKNQLTRLSKEPFSLSPEAREIHDILRRNKIDLPAGKLERLRFFKNLRDNIRTQTGQKDFIRQGIVRSLPYQKFLRKYFRDKKLPKELLAIPFLESSFNPLAHSKANALGIWQFMPLIASYYMPKRTLTTDYRYNVGVSSIGAAFLMAENIAIMKSWDLAVTAYNSGTKHLLRTKRKLSKRNVTLEDIIRHSRSEIFGFASRNFYAEFLALAYTLAYEEELFNGLHESDRHDVDEDLQFYLSKCAVKPSKEFAAEERDALEYYNHHLHRTKDHIPKGHVITTKTNLPKSKFFRLGYQHLQRLKPKDWRTILKDQSCSTR